MKNRKIVLFSCVLFSLLFLFPACIKQKAPPRVDKTVILDGNNQCVLPNSKCSQELTLHLLGPKTQRILYFEGDRNSVKGAKVKFVLVPGSDLKFFPEIAKSTDNGLVSTQITSGSTIGTQYFKVVPENSNNIAIGKIISGVSIEGENQETFCNHFLPSPLKVKLVDKNGKPLKGAVVYFDISSSPEKKITAFCKPNNCITNEDGVASTEVKLGDETGTYHIRVELGTFSKDLNYSRGIKVKAMGINLFTFISVVLGGLAIFIFGLKLISDGLQLIWGQKIKKNLVPFSKNRITAIIGGIIAASIIQSSSTCTMMVVSFVNTGLLSLAQAIGIIFGANIGATITAQIMACNLVNYAMPCITIGIIILMFQRKAVIKGVGLAISAFGLLFLGMMLMDEELKLVSAFPSFMAFFSRFDCTPVSGFMPVGTTVSLVIIGIFISMALQSTSAAIGVVMMLSMNGLINFYTAVPLILGSNMGTTINALFVSIDANKRAKQAALAHILFNVFGVIYMFFLLYFPYPGTNIPIFLYLIDMIVPGDIFSLVPSAIARHIAIAHTMFNVINVLILLPFISMISKVCSWIIKVDDGQAIKENYFEPRFLDTPLVAAKQVVTVIKIMVDEAWAMLRPTTQNGEFITKLSEKQRVRLAEREQKIDSLQEDVTSYLVQMTSKDLNLTQVAVVPLLMHCANDAERIADHTNIVFNLLKKVELSNRDFSFEARGELRQIWSLLSEQYENLITYFSTFDDVNISICIRKKERINSIVKLDEDNHLKRLQRGRCNVITGIVYVELLNELNTISELLKNIAEQISKIHKQYLSTIQTRDYRPQTTG